jgi:hypothetical protein
MRIPKRAIALRRITTTRPCRHSFRLLSRPEIDSGQNCIAPLPSRARAAAVPIVCQRYTGRMSALYLSQARLDALELGACSKSLLLPRSSIARILATVLT